MCWPVHLLAGSLSNKKHVHIRRRRTSRDAVDCQITWLKNHRPEEVIRVRFVQSAYDFVRDSTLTKFAVPLSGQRVGWTVPPPVESHHHSSRYPTVNVLPIILPAFRTLVKSELGCSLAELVYDATLQLPGELFHTSTPTNKELTEFLKSLKVQMHPYNQRPARTKTVQQCTFPVCCHVLVMCACE